MIGALSPGAHFCSCGASNCPSNFKLSFRFIIGILSPSVAHSFLYVSILPKNLKIDINWFSFKQLQEVNELIRQVMYKPRFYKEWTGKTIYLNFSSIFGDFFLKFFEEEVSDYLS